MRRYLPKAVGRDDIDYVLEAARLAPSWKNMQCWEFVVVEDERKRREIAGSRPQSKEWIAEAPVVIVVCADPERSGIRQGKHYYLVDVGISFEHLVLAAMDRGLGTCWVGEFDEDIVRRVLNIPDGIEVVAFTPLGYPAIEKGEVTRRRSLDEICHSEEYRLENEEEIGTQRPG